MVVKQSSKSSRWAWRPGHFFFFYRTKFGLQLSFIFWPFPVIPSFRRRLFTVITEHLYAAAWIQSQVSHPGWDISHTGFSEKGPYYWVPCPSFSKDRFFAAPFQRQAVGTFKFQAGPFVCSRALKASESHFCIHSTRFIQTFPSLVWLFRWFHHHYSFTGEWRHFVCHLVQSFTFIWLTQITTTDFVHSHLFWALPVGSSKEALLHSSFWVGNSLPPISQPSSICSAILPATTYLCIQF